MDLNERINVLIQAVEIAQKNGCLTLDDAYLAKRAIDVIKGGGNISIKACVSVLISTALIGQKSGAYTLKDSHYIYLAQDNIDALIPQVGNQPAPAPQSAPQPESTEQPATPQTNGRKKKGE